MLAIFASMSFVFVACGDDDEPDNNGTNNVSSSFVGTWEMSTSGLLGSGEGETYIQIASDNSFILVNDYGNDVTVSYGTVSNTSNTFTINYKIFQGAAPFVPSVTYILESADSKSFVLTLTTQKFTFTKVSDSVMKKYKDEIDEVIGNYENNTLFPNLTLNGTKISNILEASATNNTFSSNFWYDNFNFVFDFRYYGKISELTSGENITDEIRILSCERLNIIVIDGSYEIISGSVRVDSKTSNSITLRYYNLKIQQYVGDSEGNLYTIDGIITYSL